MGGFAGAKGRFIAGPLCEWVGIEAIWAAVAIWAMSGRSAGRSWNWRSARWRSRRGKAGHFFTRWFVKLSIRPLGNCGRLSAGGAGTPPNYGGVANLFTARLARVLVAVAGILELWAAFKELENQLIGLATHRLQEGGRVRAV